jgi:solute carrier family 31 (copper transporter), member 1
MSWTPETPAAYFGTWMFIFFLGVISRALLAAKTIIEGYWFRKFASTAVVVSTNDDGKVKVVSGGRNVLVWRTSVDVPRSLMQFVISGVNYLLMIVVMTMNVGYFFAVLAGVFFGELFFGRYITSGHVRAATGANVETTTSQQ